nr:DUF3473 domain-containing protein [candidate division Zixibacteria bacterium]
MVKNILTVDLEDWFVVENLKQNLDYRQWQELPSRVVKNTNLLLEMFDNAGVRATFFVLGWIAERHPRLIYDIASHGHEIACHSYHHRRIDSFDKEEFRRDTEMAVKTIRESCGVHPVGYRAPSWSINARIPWAFEILEEMGFIYDSSIYPIKHDIYGEPGAPKKIFKMQLENGRYLYEIPASTVNILGKSFPVGGGGYLRHSPFWFTRRMISRLNRANRPAVIYIHPWELDEDPPRLKGLSYFQKFRQYGSIKTLRHKMELLLRAFDFCSAKDYTKSLIRKPIGFER